MRRPSCPYSRRISRLAKTLIDGARRGGTDAAKIGLDKLANVGVLKWWADIIRRRRDPHRVCARRDGFIIERQFLRAAVYDGAAPTHLFRFHARARRSASANVFGVTPQIALAHAMVAVSSRAARAGRERKASQSPGAGNRSRRNDQRRAFRPFGQPPGDLVDGDLDEGDMMQHG